MSPTASTTRCACTRRISASCGSTPTCSPARSTCGVRAGWCVSSISTVGNYEYGQFWYFHQDGSIHFEMKATGILNTAGLAPGETPRYGTVVSPGVLGALPPARLQHAARHGGRRRAQPGRRGRYRGAAGRARQSVRQRLHHSRDRARPRAGGAAQRRFQCRTLLENRECRGDATRSDGRPPTSCCRSVRCRCSPARNRGWRDARPS